MTDDLLARAEALREDLEDGDDDYADEREIIAELIAEIKRLKSFADDLMGNCNILRSRAQKAEAALERQAAYVARLETEYVKSQAARLFYADHNTGAQWGQVGESYREPYEKAANTNLEKIKRGEQ